MTPVKAALLSLAMLAAIAVCGVGIYAADASTGHAVVDGYGVALQHALTGRLRSFACRPKPYPSPPQPLTRRICLSSPSTTSADSTPGPERARVDIDAVGADLGFAATAYAHARSPSDAGPGNRGTPRGSRSGRRDPGCRAATPGRMPAWQKKKSPNAQENFSPCRNVAMGFGHGLAQSARPERETPHGSEKSMRTP